MNKSLMYMPFYIVLLCLVFTNSYAGKAERKARRTDHGDLIVLNLYGSYYDMGRQRATLMGEDLKKAFEYDLKSFHEYVRASSSAAVTSPVGGTLAVLYDQVILPQHLEVGERIDDTGIFQESRGVASVLGVTPLDVLKSFYGVTTFGSTVFSATGKVTADGEAIIGRNVDWDDAYGLKKPMLVIYHPDNDDMDHISVTWPNFPIPVVGVNEAGFSISLNYFVVADGRSWTYTKWTVRRALQQASTVEEGIQIIAGAKRRALSLFISLADAEGNIAMLECNLHDCGIYRPDKDWYGQSNHARTDKMIQYDLNRSPDSFTRRAAMENAVLKYYGKITPDVAADILRDRSNKKFVNESVVANLSVINPAIVHPESRTIWHSTMQQPHGPFGEYVGYSLKKGNKPHLISADPYTKTGEFKKEQHEISAAREVLKLIRNQDFTGAEKALDVLMESGIKKLNMDRLIITVAYIKANMGRHEEALQVLQKTRLAEIKDTDLYTSFQLAKAILNDRLENRPAAIQLYKELVKSIDAHPEYTFLRDKRFKAVEGLKQPYTGPLPAFYRHLGVPG